jgi:cytochrome P450
MTESTITRSRAARRPTVAPPPGPPGLPLLGNLRHMRIDAARGFVRAREQYGDLVRYQIASRPIYLVCHPDDIKYVLVDNSRNYTKGRGLAKAKPLLGEGLLTSEGTFWRRQRRLAQPAFHREHIASLADVMTDATGTMLQRWQAFAISGNTFDVSAEMMRLTLTVVTRALFTTALTPTDIETVSTAFPPLLRWATDRVTAIFDFVEKLPTPDNRRREQHTAELNRIVYRIIDERHVRHEQHNDLLALLMVARDDESGAMMTDEQLRDEIMTIFIAGHETTALLLSWTWALLSWHPDVRRRVEDEVDAALEGRTPTAADMAKLPYLGMVISEAMRLYPPAWAILRSPIRNDRIRGYPIPAGATMILSPYVTHRHSSFWDNPEGFEPERFTPERARSRHKYAFFPFGGGPRLCIGNNFAVIEATLIAAMVCQRYRLDLVPGHPVEPELGFTMRVKDGLPVRLVRR